jgi:outer membrane protein OmpA-like peptidoglycan-associated protein
MSLRTLNFLFLFFFLQLLTAQDVKIINGGFEGRPHYGRNDLPARIEGWFDCGRIEFPAESPPDIHQGVNRDTAFWENETPSVQGKTYLGMVVRESETYESLSQRLAMPLTEGRCYSFSVYLSRSATYLSRVANSSGEKNFTNPVVFRLWGGNGLCGEEELLLASPPIDHSEWKKYNFKVEPSSTYRYIRIEAFYKTPVLFPYNGHILVDGASDFELIDCEENVELYVAEKLEKPEKKVVMMPAHKARKQKKEVFEREKKEIKIDTVVYKKPEKKKILALERNKLKKGQNIPIEKLYFKADTSKINAESFEVLNELYEFLDENQDIIVEIGGHTNNIPKHDYCNRLSTARAKAVADYLVSKGISPDRVTYKGYGKRRPIASNGTAEGRKRNQRVEIKIISIG